MLKPEAHAGFEPHPRTSENQLSGAAHVTDIIRLKYREQ